MSKKPRFQPILVAVAEFAPNGRWTIEQIKKSGACRITDKNGKHSYARSIPNAWKNVSYQARVRPDTNNTHGWPKNKGQYRY